MVLLRFQFFSVYPSFYPTPSYMAIRLSRLVGLDNLEVQTDGTPVRVTSQIHRRNPPWKFLGNSGVVYGVNMDQIQDSSR